MWKKERVIKAFRKKFGLDEMFLEKFCNFECMAYIKKDKSLEIGFVYPDVLENGKVIWHEMGIQRNDSNGKKITELVLEKNEIYFECPRWSVPNVRIRFEPTINIFDRNWKEIEESLNFIGELEEDKRYNGFWILITILDKLNISFTDVLSCKVAGLTIEDKKIQSYFEEHTKFWLRFAYYDTVYESDALSLEITDKNKYKLSFSGDKDIVMKSIIADAIDIAEPEILSLREFVNRINECQMKNESCYELIKERIESVQ